jgi:hypothetical protein
MWYSKSVWKQLEKGIDINDLSPIDLYMCLPIVKTLTTEWLFQTYHKRQKKKNSSTKGLIRQELSIISVLDTSINSNILKKLNHYYQL